MPPNSLPFISILIAARDEEENLPVCLEMLSRLEYPETRMEIWFGDDGSIDRSALLIEEFVRERSNCHLLRITETLGKAKGKANVLAHLAKKAKGELFLITDADVAVRRSWAKEMVALHKEGIGIITGCTVPQPTSFIAKLEAIDWVYALALIKLAGHFKIPLTAMGNNMLVSRAAYEAVGGYEGIPFSVTEDHQLFQEITQKGFGFEQILQTEVTVETAPATSLRELLRQRKRWAQGAVKSPWYLLVLLAVQGLFLPILVALWFVSPLIALGVWWAKFMIQSLIAGNALFQIGRSHLIPYLIPYELFNLCITLATVVAYLLPTKVKWKGRTY